MVNEYGQKCNKQTPKMNPWHPQEETQGYFSFLVQSMLPKDTLFKNIFNRNNTSHTQIIRQYAKQLVTEIIFFHA